MAKCDVCGKSSMLPEKFGEIAICKVCFLKIGGPSWKHQYDRYDEAEKQRVKAVDNLHKHNVSQNVLTEINRFFTMQMQCMVNCNCCGQPVKQLYALGNFGICERCFRDMNVSSWKDTKYDGNEEVERVRQKILNIAIKKGIPAIIVNEINKLFDSKIQKGLLCTLDNEEGQILKVFEKHCVLITTEDFDFEDMSEEYGKLLKKKIPQKGFLTTEDVQDLAKSIMKKGLVKTGLNCATSAVINRAFDSKTVEKGAFKKIRGQYKIDYSSYDYIDYQPCDNNDYGFIRFRKSRAEGRMEEDVLFFFSDDDTKYEHAYTNIVDGLEEVQHLAMIADSQKSAIENQINGSVADEILKYKNLLDIGAITQEEYDVKKKQLLGI